MIWEEELEEEMGSKGTEGSGKTWCEMLVKPVSLASKKTNICFVFLNTFFLFFYTRDMQYKTKPLDYFLVLSCHNWKL